MLYKSLILSVIFVFSTYAERGLEVKVNTATHTVTAEKSVDIYLPHANAARPDFPLMEKLEKKLAKEKALAEKLEKEQEAQKTKEKRRPLATVQELTFEPSKVRYQKFATSEMHGHGIYLTSAEQEVRLQDTKIYLLAKNKKIDYWYHNFYLKNKESAYLPKTVVDYINITPLNLKQNFSFHGLATGIYYVIVESSRPSPIAKNKKVYIAKKIKVDKYKKTITLFSKKL